MGGTGSGGATRNKPAALRELQGSQKRARHKKEPAFKPASLEIPEGLTEREAVHWGRYGDILSRSKVLTEADQSALVDFCRALAQIDDIRTQQQAPEYRRVVMSVTVDSLGNEKVRGETHPLDAQLRQWTQIARLLRSDLGLTPAARGRVAPVGDEAPADPFEQFLNGKAN
jgi:P27 family predicted phage terminase small subunit